MYTSGLFFLHDASKSCSLSMKLSQTSQVLKLYDNFKNKHAVFVPKKKKFFSNETKDEHKHDTQVNFLFTLFHLCETSKVGTKMAENLAGLIVQV